MIPGGNLSPAAFAPAPAARPILVLACGNPLRGDDAVAWEVVRWLEALPRVANVEYECVHQFTPELAEKIAASSRVVFVDAEEPEPKADGSPACPSVRARWIDPPACEPEAAAAFTHHCTPSTLLVFAKWLYQNAPDAVLVTVTGAGWELGAGLSPACRKMIPAAVDLVRQLVTAPDSTRAARAATA